LAMDDTEIISAQPVWDIKYVNEIEVIGWHLENSHGVIFYTPIENGTYYGMVMFVRFSVRPSVHPSVRHTLDNDSFRSFSQ
jgi:hypothetical protein